MHGTKQAHLKLENVCPNIATYSLSIMKNIFLSFFSILAIAPALIKSIVPPGADTPEFYLVSTPERVYRSPCKRLTIHTAFTPA
jgi:hypothetical protein